MKYCFSILAISFILSSSIVNAQHETDYKIRFKNKPVLPQPNFVSFTFDHPSIKRSQFKDNYYLLIQFNVIPPNAAQKELKQKGVDLLSYLPSKTYLAKIKSNVSKSDLEGFNIRSIFTISIANKLDHFLYTKEIPEHVWGNSLGEEEDDDKSSSMNQETKLKLKITYYEFISSQDIISEVRRNNIDVKFHNVVV